MSIDPIQRCQFPFQRLCSTRHNVFRAIGKLQFVFSLLLRIPIGTPHKGPAWKVLGSAAHQVYRVLPAHQIQTRPPIYYPEHETATLTAMTTTSPNTNDDGESASSNVSRSMGMETIKQVEEDKSSSVVIGLDTQLV